MLVQPCWNTQLENRARPVTRPVDIKAKQDGSYLRGLLRKGAAMAAYRAALEMRRRAAIADFSIQKERKKIAGLATRANPA